MTKLGKYGIFLLVMGLVSGIIVGIIWSTIGLEFNGKPYMIIATILLVSGVVISRNHPPWEKSVKDDKNKEESKVELKEKMVIIFIASLVALFLSVYSFFNTSRTSIYGGGLNYLGLLLGIFGLISSTNYFLKNNKN